MRKKILITSLILVISICASAKFHPEIKWREISQNNIIVIFPQKYEAQAFFTLDIAQEIYAKLMKLWGNPISGKIRILLTDVSDFANGYATFFPFNQIGIYLFSPAPDSSLGSYRDWIYLVLSHEMTHLFNLNSGSGLTYFLRKIFGHNPYLYPMLLTPGWTNEGMAIFGESQLNDWGRLNSPDFEIMLKTIAQKNKVPSYRKICGDPTPWPAPLSKYLYGAKFIQYLAETYGPDKIPKFIQYFTYFPITITSSYRFKKFFKKSLKQLWKEFIDNITIPESPSKNNLKILSDSGMIKKYPVILNDEKILFVSRNYQEFPSIIELNIKTGRSKKILEKMDITGLSYSEKDRKIFFSAVDYYKTHYQFSDLYQFDMDRKKLNRLTKGQRLFYPMKSENKLYCIKRIKTKSFLAYLDLKKGQEKIISEGYQSLAFLSISPDKKYIACSLKNEGDSWQIALFDLEGKLIKNFTPPNQRSYYPLWKNNHQLFFITEFQGKYKLAFLNLKQKKIFIDESNSLPDIRYFSFHPDKQNIIVQFFAANGFNLGLIKLTDLDFHLLPKNKQKIKLNKSRNFSKSEVRKYNFIRELLPKHLSFTLRKGGNEIQPGIFLSGEDILLKHYFSLSAFYGFQSNKFNYNFRYIFDGWFPTTIINYHHFSDLYKSSADHDYIHNEKNLEIIGIFPLLYRNKHYSLLYTDIHFEKIIDDFFNLSLKDQYNLHGMKLALFFNSAKNYYDSISYSDGFQMSVSYSRELKFLGSDYDINTASVEYRHYLSLLRPNVLAIRLVMLDSWGEARKIFYLGGTDSQEGLILTDNNPFDLMRGYPSGFFYGSGGYVFNLEYRISLFKIEKSFLLFGSVERFFITIFADMGNLWLTKKIIRPSFCYGLELNLIAFLGEKLNFSAGVAFGHRPQHPAIFYFRLGKSF